MLTRIQAGSSRLLIVKYAIIFREFNALSYSRLPTDVQAEAIPLILGGGDVLMAAETGSGKTGAFCLPVLQITWEALKDLQEGKGLKGGSGGRGKNIFKSH